MMGQHKCLQHIKKKMSYASDLMCMETRVNRQRTSKYMMQICCIFTVSAMQCSVV